MQYMAAYLVRTWPGWFILLHNAPVEPGFNNSGFDTIYAYVEYCLYTISVRHTISVRNTTFVRLGETVGGVRWFVILVIRYISVFL